MTRTPPSSIPPLTLPITGRQVCVFLVIVVCTLVFALSPTRERRTRVVVDTQFKQEMDVGSNRHKYPLGLLLEKGKTYFLSENTHHVVKMTDPITRQLVAKTEYVNSVSMAFEVLETTWEEIVCKAKMIDFVGYDEIEDEEEDDDPTRVNRNELMYDKVRESTKGVEFQVVLSHQGTVKRMETSKLRRAIISGLHEAGQLPMHLEHAVVVGKNDVFPANGASFGPQGITRVAAPVLITKREGCNLITDGSFKGRIVVLSRGGCAFQKKAKLAAEAGASALVVVDTDAPSGPVGTYMGGEDDVPIVSVIVNGDCLKALEKAMESSSNFLKLENGDLTASGNDLFAILGGASAIEKLNEVHNADVDDDAYADFANDDYAAKKEQHHLDPVHTDGLHDFVGIGYVVDEVIRTRFSIFPPNVVAIGSSWERSLELSDRVDPSVRAKVDEVYKLVSVSKLSNDESGGTPGDLVAQVKFAMEERPASKKLRVQDDDLDDTDDHAPNNQATEDDADEDDDEEGRDDKVVPQFSRPSFKGHTLKTTGEFNIHMATGHVLFGESTSTVVSERNVIVMNKKTGKQKSMKAHVLLEATTLYNGVVPARR